VAREAVCGWYREERSAVLVLTNDLRVPVARNRLAMLRAEGWLSPDAEVRPQGEALTFLEPAAAHTR
jgi:hypothetical protein